MRRALYSLSLLWVVSLMGCMHYDEPMNEVPYPKTLEDARKEIQRGDYVRAEARLKNYIGTPRDVYWHGQAYVLLGEAREKAGHLDDAIESYKAAVSQGAGYDSRVMVQGLYRLSWVYEKQKRYEDLLTLLFDLEKNMSGKDYFIRYIETPARIANTYFVMGNWERTLEYRALISKEHVNGLHAQEVLKREPVRYYNALLYRSLSGIRGGKSGSIPPSQVLPLIQKELLDIGELADAKTAERALDFLNHLYQEQWKPMREKKKFKTIEEQLNFNRGKLDQLALFLDQIEGLKGVRRPQEVTTNPFLVSEFFKKLGVIEKQIRAYSGTLNLGIQKAK